MSPRDGVLGLILAVARTSPGHVAVVDADGTPTTYGALVGRSARLAHHLVGVGLEPGDRVAAWLDDGVPYVELYLAAAMAGLVVVPVNARYTTHEARALIVDSEPRAVVWSSARDGAVEDLADVLPQTRLRVGGGPPPLLATDRAEVVATGSTAPLSRAGADDLYVIGYTSGTTGTPKGALLTHRSVVAVARQHRAAYRLAPRSTIAMTGSMSFVSVVPAHVLTHLAIGGTVVFLGHWDVPHLAAAVDRHRATFTYLPSPVLGDFARHAARAPERWASLTTILHSASKAAADSLAAVVDVVGDRLIEGWGMTENSGGLMTATSASDAGDPVLLETVGRPIDGYEVRVVDDELSVRGPGLASGYWRRPRESAAAFSEGWFATGDIGSVDERGYVTLLERRTDLVVSGGMNVYPAEVEGVIDTVPGVVEVAVVGVPHPRWGQSVVAVVVPGTDAGPDLRDRVLARCRERLSGYKKPTDVLFVDALPRTVALKVSRAAVRAAALERLSLGAG
ncbi:acyl--CoA ligase [Nocardioides carbamazepini]|uniref:class I adenylate-forming enzyme family protein n=1 Tax=Nocardioides carbamazepini TaxID=2854259 RepID=UPI00214A481C|nr:class I adenylate-forming enzyme family protein [Nocardioides carbamazepini]MCR1783679.1 acyl--CoA ligase [Nocardioides carbamazepini]